MVIGLTLAGVTATGGTFAVDQAINPYEDKGTYYELPIVSDIPQGERVEIAKDKAAMTLKGWNDEYAITITPQIPTTQLRASDRPFSMPAKRPLLSKRMEFTEGDVTAFIEPRDGTQNEFDIDFTLQTKPDTNVFTYKIEGAEEFDFFYQPELTPEEITEESSRPKNVVGSYAVYHKTKANHRVGDTNYSTGKAFHIYRPKAIDANGDEVWAKLSYNNGILSLTLPQQYLDTATYPVKVDPTFGYTTQGASILANQTSSTNKICNMVSQLTASTGDTLTQYSLFASSTNVNVSMSMTAYTVTAGSPDALFAAGTTVTITSGTATWYNSATVSQSLTNGTTYCVALGFGLMSGFMNLLFDNGTAPGRFNSSSVGFSDPFAVSGTDSGRHYSWYATYTAAGGATTDTTFINVLEN